MSECASNTNDTAPWLRVATVVALLDLDYLASSSRLDCLGSCEVEGNKVQTLPAMKSTLFRATRNYYQLILARLYYQAIGVVSTQQISVKDTNRSDW